MPKRVKPETWAKQKQRYYKKHSKYGRPGLVRWSDKDKRMLKDFSISDVELSQQLRRSVKAIHVQRSRMRKREYIPYKNVVIGINI